jgi:peptidyl-tRNA hydrolase, PTH1 family
MSDAIQLVVGLGNPGQQYQHTRHNAGAMFLTRLCASAKGELRPDSKFSGHSGRVSIAGHEVRLLFPTTFMNNSGRAVAAITQYYKLTPSQVLIAYDELDLPVGTTRLKVGGGPGGHNGVRDVMNALASPDFVRLRIGIGHPGDASKVLNYVLGEFNRLDAEIIDGEIAKAIALMPLLVEGKLQQAMSQLHTKT